VAVTTQERETEVLAPANLKDARRRRQFSGISQKTVIYALLIAGAVIFVGPFAWMFTASLQDVSDMFSWPPSWIPSNPSLNNYVEFFKQERVGRYFFNSAYVALAVTALQLFTSSLAAYTFAKRRFPGRDILFIITLGTLMIPGQVTLIPNYVILKHIPYFGGNDAFGTGGSGWLDSYWGLIVPQAASAFGIFLLRQYMMSIPDDLLDAARIDGGSEFRIFAQIVMPLCRPALAALGIFTITYQWDDFFWPLIIVTSEELRTLPLGLALFVVRNRTAWDLLMAGSVIATVPMVVIFLLFQRQFIRGIAISGMKG
jgi:multiple sugar transport system permease protein